MLLIDENTQCVGRCSNYIIGDTNLESILIQALNRTEYVSNPTLRIPTNISPAASKLAYGLAAQNRNVHVIAIDENCSSSVNELLDSKYDGVVIDGKLFLNGEDGPICTL